jgi:hypothetical protein
MSAGRRGTALDAKKARQKKFVIIGSVLLVAVLIFQVPRTLKSYHKLTAKPPAASAVSSAAPAESGSPTATTPGAVVPAPAPPATTLPNTDVVVVQPGSGQLASFGLFKTKDPFVQQLGSAPTSTPTPATTAPPATVPAAPTTPSTPTVASPLPATPVTTPVVPLVPRPTVALPTGPPVTLPTSTVPASTPTPTTPTPAPPTSTTPPSTTPTSTTPAPAPHPQAPSGAAISTNGRCETIPVRGLFPGADDIFRVVSIAADGQSVKIGIVGGSYESGAPAIILKKGTSLTLVNSADGLRYKLNLLASCVGQPGPSTTPSTTAKAPGTLTVPTPAPPPSTTAPIPTTTTSTTPTTPTGP